MNFEQLVKSPDTLPILGKVIVNYINRVLNISPKVEIGGVCVGIILTLLQKQKNNVKNITK